MQETELRDGHDLTPEQQQIVDDGLRILARMIARRAMQEEEHREGSDASGDGHRR